jgi:hypothetical protein
MRRTSARLSLAAAGLAALGLALPAHAGAVPAKLVVTDAAGDAFSGPLSALTGGADELTKMTWTTTGTTVKKKVGKKVVTTYTPKNLVVVLETAGDIDTTGATQYDVEGTADGCGDFYMYVAPGSLLEGIAGSCGDDEAVDFASTTYAVAGRTITFTVPLGSVTGVKAGKKITGLNAYTGQVDPVTGELGPVLLGGTLATDSVASDATFAIV